MTGLEAILSVIRSHAANERMAKTQRDAAILLARQNKATLRQIADAANLTPAGIAKILKKHLTT